MNNELLGTCPLWEVGKLNNDCRVNFALGLKPRSCKSSYSEFIGVGMVWDQGTVLHFSRYFAGILGQSSFNLGVNEFRRLFLQSSLSTEKIVQRWKTESYYAGGYWLSPTCFERIYFIFYLWMCASVYNL